MAYGTSIRAFRPHTNAVRVGAASCGVIDTQQAYPGQGSVADRVFNDTQKMAWAQQCGSGEARLPLGTTARTIVSGGPDQTFLFQAIVPCRAFQIDIDDAVASGVLILSLKFGLNERIIGGEVPGASFTARSGRDFAELFSGCMIYPSIPAQLVVRNISGGDVFLRANMWVTALT